MTIKTQNKKVSFMNGKIDVDGEIDHILINAHGQREFLLSDFDTDNAVYSDGFIKAVESGLIPELELHNNRENKSHKEYHHVVINDECFFVFFN